MKKLLVTATDLMTVQFLLPHLRNLSQSWDITLACSQVGGRLQEVRDALPGIPVHEIRLRRNPFWVGNLLGYRELRKIVKDFDVIWTNEPVMGAVTRLAAGNSGAKVLYLCHGFHFFRGGPVGNWVFYPVERWLARFTDLTVTVNREDFARASAMAPAAYIHGIGVGLKTGSRENLRRELGLGPGDRLALCVGELNRNKAQASALRALKTAGDPRLHLALCGRGNREKYLRKLAKRLKIEENVHFLGYRRDMGDVYAAADLLVHPARREGLGLAVLEGALAGLPVIARDTRGIRDYGENLLHPGTVTQFAEALMHPPKPIPAEKLTPYLLENVEKELESLINSL